MNSENEIVMDSQQAVKQDFLGDITDYYDAVIRLTAIFDDCNRAQEMVDGWDEDKPAT